MVNYDLPYYILPSYKRYTFETIIDDNYQKYFIGSLYSNNLLFSTIRKDNINQMISDEIYFDYYNINSDIYIENEEGTAQKKQII